MRNGFSVLALLCLAGAISCPSPRFGTSCASPRHFNRLAALLRGPWTGRAVITPLGPRPYNIKYKQTETGVTGRAHPSGVTHSWNFIHRPGGLRLNFLSDFGGNKEPLKLIGTGCAGNRFEFARDAVPVRVRIEFKGNELIKRIRLRGKEHVLIRLRRGSPGKRFKTRLKH